MSLPGFLIGVLPILLVLGFGFAVALLRGGKGL